MKERKILTPIFEWIGKLVITHPKAIVVFFALVTITMLFFDVKVRVNPSLLLLLPRDDPQVREYEELNAHTNVMKTLIIGIYTKGDVVKGKAFAKEIVTKLNDMKDIISYVPNNNGLKIKRDYAMYFLSKSDLRSLKKALDTLNSSTREFFKLTDLSSFGNTLSSLNDIQKYIERLSMNSVDIGESNYVISKDKSIILIYAYMSRKASDMSFVKKAMPELRRVVDTVNKRYKLPYRFAGQYESNYEANEHANVDLWMTVILSLIFMFILSYIFYRNLLLSMAFLCSLGVSVIWTLGLVRLTYGYFNLISVSTVVILVGLGMDYGIDLMSKFIKGRYRGRTVDESIYMAISQNGIGIFGRTGITAAAFFSLSFLKLPALYQIGFIAGWGTIFFSASMLALLPSILLISKKYMDKLSIERDIPKRISRWYTDFLNKYYRKLIITTIVVSIILGCFTIGLFFSYDYSISGLLDRRGDASILTEDMVKKFGYNPSAQVMILANSIHNVNKIVNKLKTYEYAGKIYSLFDILPPSVDNEKITLVNDVCKRLKDLSNNVLFRMILKKYELESIVLNPSLPQDSTSLIMEIYEELPHSMKKAYIYKDGNSIEYPIILSPNVNIYKNNNLKSFINTLNDYDSHFIGYPVLDYRLMKSIQKNMAIAAILVFTVAFVAIWLVLKRTWASLLAISMLLFSMNMMFGLMYLLSLRINLMTFLVAPLIIGMGINSFIPILYRYLEKQVDGFRVLITDVGTRITLSSLTTISAFGTLIFARTRLLADVGISMMIGIASCYFISCVLLIALLRAREKA